NRLGTWDQARTRIVNCSEVPLADGGRLAHVALIYSNLADLDPHLWAALETTAKGLIGFGHYTSVANLVRTAFVDLEAIFKHSAYERRAATPSLQVRRDLAPGQDPGGLVAVLERLQRDIATYICRNDLRERARGFVREALLRLCARDDVAGLVVNAHSQGTTVAYDVLRALPPSAARKVRHLVTAGSPLRKYSQLCYWGRRWGTSARWG